MKNEAVGRGNSGIFSRIRNGKNYRNWEAGFSPCETHLGLLTGTY